jgi:hypothetical protein
MDMVKLQLLPDSQHRERLSTINNKLAHLVADGASNSAGTFPLLRNLSYGTHHTRLWEPGVPSNQPGVWLLG